MMKFQKTACYLIAGIASVFLSCQNNPESPPMTTQNPDGIIWSDSGWKGLFAIDMAKDTMIKVYSDYGMTASMEVDNGDAIVGFSDGSMMKFAKSTLTAVDSCQASADSASLSKIAINGNTIWAADNKIGRSANIIKLEKTPLKVSAVHPLRTDMCKVLGMKTSSGQIWILCTNPPELARLDTVSFSLTNKVSLGTYMRDKGQFGLSGRTAYVLTDSCMLIKINIDAGAIVSTHDLRLSMGKILDMAVSSSGVFICNKDSDTMSTVYKILNDPAVPSGTWNFAAKPMFLSASGQRLVAVVGLGYYNRLEEIDITTMTLKRELKKEELYCYNLAIE